MGLVKQRPKAQKVFVALQESESRSPSNRRPVASFDSVSQLRTAGTVAYRHGTHPFVMELDQYVDCRSSCVFNAFAPVEQQLLG
jgi:hypothetical protein